MIEFAPPPERGRRFESSTTVRLGDVGADGYLRPHGLARLLQDVASDDWAETGIAETATWVVRRTSFRLVGRRWPSFGERIVLTTFCSGTGAAWAERRTNLSLDGEVVLEAVGLWVPVDPVGRPQRIRPVFFDVYGEAAAGRRVTGRVPAPAVTPPSATRRPWPLRRADLDVVGHVNNAALWATLTEVADGPVGAASMIHHGPVLGSDDVTLVSASGQLWLEVGGVVAVSAAYVLS
jgi:acyl-ACP thioesterase